MAMNKSLKIGLVVSIAAIISISVILIPSLLFAESRIGSVDYVKITILLDNNPNGTLLSPWGLSILVETDDLTILFDSGIDPVALENNSEQLGIDLVSDCDFIVVSHEHPDHVNGLTFISDSRENVTLYTPYYGYTRSWTRDFFQIEVEDYLVVTPGISIVGRGLDGVLDYSEQALVVNVENLGLVILVGCSHPGVDNIVSKVMDDLNVNDIYMVLGGFHMLNENQETIEGTIDALINMGVQHVYPVHCSGNETRNYLESTYPANYGEAAVGFQIALNGINPSP